MDEARTISAADWSEHLTVLQQEAPDRPGTIRDGLLGPMDPEVARSFTDAQLRELERVLIAPTSGCRPIDIRITVPFFRRRYFVTFLAGPELRSAERLKADRAKHAIVTAANICFLAFLLTLIIPAMIGLFHIITTAG